MLTLLEGEDAPDSKDKRLEDMQDAMSTALADAMQGHIVAVCILGLPAEGCQMGLYNTVDTLGDLALLRDEFSEFIMKTLTGQDDEPLIE